MLQDNFKRYISSLFRRRQAYKTVFSTKAGKMVLADLRKICGAVESSYSSADDPHLTVFREGKRKVWLHIQELLNLDENQIHKLKETEEEMYDA